ncbi:MAG: transporter [Subtercola sp.]|nr:transporter [Subtercola sp.]
MTLEITSLHVQYGAVTAVDNLDLVVDVGGVTSLIGPNGAGKTSAVRAVMGAIASSGTVRLDGKEIRGKGTHRRVHHGISYVPDDRGVFPQISVKEHIRLAVGGRAGWLDRWDYLVDLFPIIGEKQNALGSELSGGQQKSLSIARALAPAPRYIVLDEPSIGLSPIAIIGVIEAIERLAESGVGVLLAEQNASIALGVSREVHVMARGAIRLTSTPAELRGTEVLRRLYLGLAPE